MNIRKKRALRLKKLAEQNEAIEVATATPKEEPAGVKTADTTSPTVATAGAPKLTTTEATKNTTKETTKARIKKTKSTKSKTSQ